jgi:hypothetical protein
MADAIARRLLTRAMPAGAALKFASRLIRPVLITAIVGASIGDAPAVLPLACGITWTMVGTTIIFEPDCAHPVPGGPPPYPEPPPPPEGPPPPP